MIIDEREFSKIMNICETSDCFYYVDKKIGDSFFRIFNYRLASYSDWLIDPVTIELRGIMFEITEEGEFVRVASRPFEKFFNYLENNFTMDIDFSNIVEISDKADGSLISSYMIEDQLFLKTKTSLDSEQAVAAMEWLNENANLKHEIFTLEKQGYTVIAEWTSPANRIVLGYVEPKLILLGVRDRNTGEYIDHNDIQVDKFPTILSYWTQLFEVEDPEMFVKHIPNIKEPIEGFVIRLKSGLRVKVKTLKYLALHHTKDSINSPRRLFEAVLEEATDDMRSMFYDDPVAIRMIEEMETFVDIRYNRMVASVERFYEANKHLERKEYAILGQRELDSMFFGLAMNRYLGKTVDYKAFLKGKWKEMGLKDQLIEEN